MIAKKDKNIIPFYCGPVKILVDDCMIPFPERIKVIFTALETTPHKFANTHGLNRTTVFNLLNDDRRPNFELIERICLAEPRISAEFLVRGEGEPLRDKLQAQTFSILDQLNALKVEINAPLDKRIQELSVKLTTGGE